MVNKILIPLDFINDMCENYIMDIRINNILNNNLNMIQEKFGTKVLKNSLELQKYQFQQLLNILPDPNIGKKLDITI